MKKITVLGANGRLGRLVVEAFNNADYEVTAVTRSGKLADRIDGVSVLTADCLDQDCIIAATAGADFIFNGLNPVYTDWQTKALPMAENAIAAAREHGSVHLFPANVYNYGTAIPETVTPLTPKLADTRKGKIREAMENRFRAAAREDGVKTIMVRCGDFFGGTGTGSWFDLAIAKKLASGVFTAPGPETMMHAWAYMPDVAQTFVKLADLHGSLDTWSDLLFEGHTVTLHQMKEHLELIMGQNLKSSPLPWWLVRFVAPFNGMMRETLEMSYLWHRPHRLDGSELVSILGKVPRTPLREALKSAVEAQGTSTGKPLVSKPSELAIG